MVCPILLGKTYSRCREDEKSRSEWVDEVPRFSFTARWDNVPLLKGSFSETIHVEICLGLESWVLGA